MKVLFAAIMVAALSVASNAFSQDPENIGYMRNACKVLTNEKPPSTQDKKAILHIGTCAGFIKGQRAWRETACVIFKKPSEKGRMDWFTRLTARNTQGHTLEALAQSFINWANDHPEKWSHSLHAASVSDDLWSEFPCEATN